MPAPPRSPDGFQPLTTWREHPPAEMAARPEWAFVLWRRIG